MFEAQLGSLRDLDHGIYPMTTSSNTIAAYAPVGSGLPSAQLDRIIGVVKAYSTCVGEGPFTCEMFGEEAEKLREAGHEYGAKTGRPIPDFRTGGCPVNSGVRGVNKLSGNEAVGRFLGQLFSLGNGALHALGTLGQYQLGTIGLEDVTAFHAHGFRHGQDDAVALGGGDGGQADS